MLLITSLLASTAYAETFAIDFRVVNVNSVSSSDEQRISEGIQFFNQILQRQCGFQMRAQIIRQDLHLEDSRFRFESIWSARDIAGIGKYFFRFFQEKMYSVTTENNLQQKNNEVSIFVAPHLDMCGFAFPDIQFLDEETLAKNPDMNINSHIMPWIRNRVIIGATSQNLSDCSNSNRLVAHELAHIFIQDRSPHTCWDESRQQYRGCPEDNILATRRLIYAEPRPGRPRPPGYGMDEPEVRPAIGSIITPRQCQDILNTVRSMLSETH